MKQDGSVVALAGGIGAAKLLLGMSRLMSPDRLVVVGNTGDDIVLHGLRICPDLDTVAYTLTGRVNPVTGWGVADDTFECLRRLRELGDDTWFQLGDRDLALHIFRTRLLAEGVGLAEATRRIGQGLGLRCRLVPMSQGFHPTYLETDHGRLHLQEYLVRERCRPVVTHVEYTDIEGATPPHGLIDAIQEAQAVIFCPSNPFISIGPILAVEKIRAALESLRVPVVAVTPIVAGAALKGPAAKMLRELGHQVSPVGVAKLYAGLVTRFVLDRADAALAPEIEKLGMEALVSDTVMNSLEDKSRLATELMEGL